jgi:hypothetical protein
MRVAIPLVSICLVASAWVALAQPVPPTRIRGTVEAFDGRTLTVATSTTGRVQLTLAETTGINGLEAKSAADLRDNVFIGTTAVKDAAGRWQATEVHIFPEAMRGAGEGHYAWDLPESTMTNAAVTGTAATTNGRTMRLKYATGEVEVDVTPKTVIVGLTAGDRSLLVPGAAVFALAVPQDGGGLNAVAIIAETKGIKPPM